MQQQADIEEENTFMATKSNPTLQESVWVDIGHLADRLVTKTMENKVGISLVCTRIILK